MNWGTVIRTSISCAILIMLHYTLRPLLGWRAPIDFMLIAGLFGAVRMRPGWAAVYGLALGLVSDALAVNGGFGAAALSLTLVAYSASWLKAVFFADNLALNAFFLFVGKWIFDLAFDELGGYLVESNQGHFPGEGIGTRRDGTTQGEINLYGASAETTHQDP